MHSEAQTIARLKSMVFLIKEALRIADEGGDALLGAKLSDCIDCVYSALAEIDNRPSASASTLAADDSAAVNSATLSI